MQRPVCGRCQHRGIIEKCFYHPAPLTKPRGTGSLRPGATNKVGTPQIVLGTHGPVVVDDNSDEPIHFALRAGNESESDVRNSQFQDPEANLRRQVSETLKLLEPLRHVEEIAQLVEYYVVSSQVALVPAPIMRYATSTLLETAREVSSLRGNGTNADALTDFASAVLYHTSSPVVVHPDLEYEAFVDMFTGKHLRLEMLGLIYTIAARSRVYRHPRSAVRHDSITYQLFKASQAALNLARELAPTINDVLIWLAFDITRLYTNAQGDSHPNTWRAMADLTCDAYIMDLHREAKVSANAPFWLAESRRKNWISEWNVNIPDLAQN